MKSFFAWLEKISKITNKMLTAVAGTMLLAMLILACTNIAFRTFWVPLKATFELMGFFGAVVAAFALGRTQMSREHIAVDVLVQCFPPGIKRMLNGVNYGIGMIFFLLVAWQTARWGTTLRTVNELSETLRIMYYPFVYCLSLGCLVMALVLFLEAVKLVVSEKKEHL